MFAYCHNNPLLYVDLSGFIIVLATDATEEQEEDYERAVAYIKTSETGQELIEYLEGSPIVFTIMFIDDGNMRYDPARNLIFFDPHSGLILGDGISVQSAALGLAHEMGHAAQHLDGTIFLTNSNTSSLELLNLTTYETPIARELGEPVRNNYYDTSGDMRMQNPTHFRTVSARPWWHYIFIWNWFIPYTIDHNVDN